MRKFVDFLAKSQAQQGSLLCVGLDPDVEKLPPAMRAHRTPLFAFSREIIEATAQWACAFKPQIAYYAALGAEHQLQQTIAYIKQHHPHIPVILDAKRGDIGATAKMYAREAFERYQADAVTVNPYLGGDALAPFLEYRDHSGADKGVFILCRTSNPGSGSIQQLHSRAPTPVAAAPPLGVSDGAAEPQFSAGGRSVAHQVATYAAEQWNDNGNVGLVVGATWCREIAAIRKLVGDMPLLVPGVGAQGGDLQAVLAAGLTAPRAGLLINVSRAILYAGNGRDFAAAAATAAAGFCEQIQQFRRRQTQPAKPPQATATRQVHASSQR